ncbi:MAG TPA: hypothetical protein VGH79_05385 [Gaiellaceae bacterium]|jgi:hypothetical protein
MSYDAETSIPRDPAERSTATTVAGYLSSFAIFFSFIGIFWHPLRLILPALVLALVAAGMVKGRLQFAAVLIGAVCLFLGLAVAVATSHALW